MPDISMSVRSITATMLRAGSTVPLCAGNEAADSSAAARVAPSRRAKPERLRPPQPGNRSMETSDIAETPFFMRPCSPRSGRIADSPQAHLRELLPRPWKEEPQTSLTA